MQVALGVTGGIAAYKSAELLRRLQDRGFEVQVIMTDAARQFVTPLTFAALSGRKVITGLFDEAAGEANLASVIEHTAVAQNMDALVIAPATADIIAKMAAGIADDFLTTLYLAARAPTIVAPAMNVNMWEHPATQHNLQILRDRGVHVIEPEEGYLACGMIGAGRLAAVETIAQTVFETLSQRSDLEGETVLVTAGRTEEPLDPCRFLSNRSSGKMGYALAEAARRRGARVTLISGRSSVDPPPGMVVERVRTALEMMEAVNKHFHEVTIFLMAAAVADFRPMRIAPAKLKRNSGALALRLEPTADILGEVARRRKPRQLLVGFAAETENVVSNASAKLRAKQLDLMVANDVTQPGAGFEVDTNIVTLLFADGRQIPLQKMGKLDVAHRILDAVAQLRSKLGAEKTLAIHVSTEPAEGSGQLR
jgi:phosphopantothenoylcysteine decarboxylase/phosphopantothenate--cysteine ligase